MNGLRFVSPPISHIEMQVDERKFPTHGFEFKPDGFVSDSEKNQGKEAFHSIFATLGKIAPNTSSCGYTWDHFVDGQTLFCFSLSRMWANISIYFCLRLLMCLKCEI